MDSEEPQPKPFTLHPNVLAAMILAGALLLSSVISAPRAYQVATSDRATAYRLDTSSGSLVFCDPSGCSPIKISN